MPKNAPTCSSKFVILPLTFEESTSDDNGTPIEKKEEGFAMVAIKHWIKVTSKCDAQFRYEPQGYTKPPDFSVKFKDESFLLEVRRSGGGYLLSPENKGACTKNEWQGIDLFCMQNKIKDFIVQANLLKPDETIVLIFKSHIPIKGRGKLARKIANEVVEVYKNNKIPVVTDLNIEFLAQRPNNLLIVIDGLYFELFLTKYYYERPESSKLKFILAASSHSFDFVVQSNLRYQARMILENTVEEKTKKLTNLDGKKWLAIVNTHPLLTAAEYNGAFKDIICEHPSFFSSFEKLFVICDVE